LISFEHRVFWDNFYDGILTRDSGTKDKQITGKIDI